MKPQIGMIIKVYGFDCRVFKIHALGTIEVERLDGSRCYRLSGLGF